MWEENLDLTHPVVNTKVSTEGKPRPIFTKFTSYNVRNIVYKNKKKLKGKNFLITVPLTAATCSFIKRSTK